MDTKTEAVLAKARRSPAFFTELVLGVELTDLQRVALDADPDRKRVFFCARPPLPKPGEALPPGVRLYRVKRTAS